MKHNYYVIERYLNSGAASARFSEEPPKDWDKFVDNGAGEFVYQGKAADVYVKVYSCKIDAQAAAAFARWTLEQECIRNAG